MGYDFRYVFNYALALHASYINNKSAPLPDGTNVHAEIARFLRRLGYRLELRESEHPAEVAAGKHLELKMKWRNTGSAPCYRPYRLADRLTDEAAHQHTAISPITVDRWLPGSIPVFTPEFMESPSDLPPGPVASEVDRVAIRAISPRVGINCHWPSWTHMTV